MPKKKITQKEIIAKFDSLIALLEREKKIYAKELANQTADEWQFRIGWEDDETISTYVYRVSSPDDDDE